MPDNRLPTNQSQLDIIQAIDNVKTAINNLNFILDAQNIAYDSNTSVKEKLDRVASSWTGLGSTSVGGSLDISNTNFDVYSATIVISNQTPNLFFNIKLDRGNLSANPAKFLTGSWATGNYGQSIEIQASLSEVRLNSVYINGSALTSNVRLYLAGRYER